MSKLTSARVHEIYKICLYTDEELPQDPKTEEDLPDGAVIVEGIMHKTGFHPGRLEEHREEITAMVMELPDEFMASVEELDTKSAFSVVEFFITDHAFMEHLNIIWVYGNFPDLLVHEDHAEKHPTNQNNEEAVFVYNIINEKIVRHVNLVYSLF